MPPRAGKSLASSTSSALTSVHEAPQWQCRTCQQRTFASTPSHSTRLRRDMFAWLNGPGRAFKEPLPGSTNYLGAYDKRGRLIRQQDQASEIGKQGDRGTKTDDPKIAKESVQDLRPFPYNTSFYSQSILSEELRNEIYRRVKVLGQPVRLVSAQLGVELRRIGAVVRLVELEQRWIAEGKPLATPYAKAVHEMVPTTPYTPGKPTAHESINDLPVHALTDPQIFWPTAESRTFTRTDAGRVFSGAHRQLDGDTTPTTQKPEQFELIGKPGHERAVLLPADARIPHPHLIDYHRDQLDPEINTNKPLLTQRYNSRIQQELEKIQVERQKKKDYQEKTTKRVQAGRFEFIFKEVQTTREGTGLDGRGTNSPGYRYGVPQEDRKRGQVKIPRNVAV